jgi:hypothetical protein
VVSTKTHLLSTVNERTVMDVRCVTMGLLLEKHQEEERMIANLVLKVL